MEITFSLDFFRKHFYIPQGVRLCWCVILKSDDDTEQAQERLGVMICDTDKVIDVAGRQIVVTSHPSLYSAYPAVVYEGGGKVELKTSNGCDITVSDTYIEDCYSLSVYSEK